MRRFVKLKKLNNKGLSLVELLTVVVILAIVIAPFMHSFITAARTNSKAAITLTATNLAENTLEEFQTYDLEKLLTMHANTEEDGKYSFSYTADCYQANAGAYTISVGLDPKSGSSEEYEDWNNMNVSEIENINGNTCAVYAMRVDDESRAIDSLANKIRGHVGSMPSGLYDELKANVTRKTEVYISSNGEIAIPNGDGTNSFIKHVKVTVKTSYIVPAAHAHGLSDAEATYTLTYEVYDNRISKQDFSSVYIIFTPRESVIDQFIIYNSLNIQGDIYILGQKTTFTWPTANKHAITVIENPAWALGAGRTVPPGAHSALRLRTNLYKPNPSGLLSGCTKYFTLNYKTTTKEFVFTDALSECMSVMNARTEDGRYFDDKGKENRIYEITVTITKDGEDICTMMGTKLE